MSTLTATDGRVKGNNHSITDAALRFNQVGLCVLPLRPSTKKPVVSWKQLQHTRPSEAQLIAWFRKRDLGIAVVQGAVSGGLSCRDFDVEGGHRQWAGANQALAKALPTARTARCHHVYFRSEFESIEVLEDGELRGNGITVLPPTCHASGHVYQWENGLPGHVSEVPFLDPAEVGHAHRVGTQQAQQPQAIGWGEEECEKEAHSARPLEDLIRSTLPMGPGQRNHCIFRLARAGCHWQLACQCRPTTQQTLADEPPVARRRSVQSQAV